MNVSLNSDMDFKQEIGDFQDSDEALMEAVTIYYKAQFCNPPDQEPMKQVREYGHTPVLTMFQNHTSSHEPCVHSRQDTALQQDVSLY